MLHPCRFNQWHNSPRSPPLDQRFTRLYLYATPDALPSNPCHWTLTLHQLPQSLKKSWSNHEREGDVLEKLLALVRVVLLTLLHRATHSLNHRIRMQPLHQHPQRLELSTLPHYPSAEVALKGCSLRLVGRLTLRSQISLGYHHQILAPRAKLVRSSMHRSLA